MFPGKVYPSVMDPREKVSSNWNDSDMVLKKNMRGVYFYFPVMSNLRILHLLCGVHTAHVEIFGKVIIWLL